jgi:diguanylate cyclase (GGDEF)-like protein
VLRCEVARSWDSPSGTNSLVQGLSIVTDVRTSRPSQYVELVDFLKHVGKDPSKLVFEDELTGIHNRRYLRSYLEHKIDWESEKENRLTILIIDLDHFKQINDSQGHETGDQVLTWMAALLKDVAGDTGIPVRFAGDEFILLLPKTSRAQAREVADRLLQRTRDRPFRLREADVTLPITLSIGIASAPEDGRDPKTLFQAADTALYHAKQSGRNQAASAGEVDPGKVFPKTALHRLIATGIAGRDEELGVVSDALEALTRGESRFLVIDGGPGMGKSAFLETVRSNLAGNAAYSVIKVAGDQQEGYRPYYMITRALVALLNERADSGQGLFPGLSTRELGYMAHVLPRLAEAGTPAVEEDESRLRQGIFGTIARFLPRVIDFRPLILLLDDLHYADEASLYLLRMLIQRKELTLMVCGSTLESLKLVREEEAPPLERFYSSRHKELGMRRVALRPLEGDDIAEYLRGVFPSLTMPQGFEQELAATTQGNPLFLGEIIRKLVGDRRVTLEGLEWVIQPLEEGYLPRSLEEIVMQKISQLDEEGREILERASAMGDDVSVSVLSGSSQVDENRVLEFLDRAEALGLVSLDFQINDEVMHFLGKQVAEISYGVINPERRKELHERIGSYQEGLYDQQLLPSASMLAYHFKRSANQEKARHYERIQLQSSQLVFDPNEAAEYTGDILEEEVVEERRLEPESLPLVPHVLRTFNKAVRNIQLYPAESKAVTQSVADVLEAMHAILADNEQLHLSQDQRFLLANGQRVDVTDFTSLSDSFLEILTRAELRGMTFRQGLTENELAQLVLALSQLKPDAITLGYWKSFTLDRGLDHLELEQVRYSRVVRRKATARVTRPAVQEEALEADEVTHVPEILRALQGAGKIVKLYPLDSNPVVSAITRLHGALQPLFQRHDVVTLAGTERSLLINGARVDTAAFDTLATSVVDWMGTMGLGSLSFYTGVPHAEIESFVGALREVPAGADRGYWDEFAQQKVFAGIAFNQQQYAVGVVQSLLGDVDAVEEETGGTEAAADFLVKLADDPSEALLEALPRFGKELLVKGEWDLVRLLLKKMFVDFQAQPPATREHTVKACRTLLDLLILGLQKKLTEVAVDKLLESLAEENEPQVLREFGSVLHAMANIAVQFGDHQMATRILLALKERRQEIEDAGFADADTLSKLLERPLEAAVQQLLVEDLRSGEPERQARAAQVVGSQGRAGIPLLLEVIRKERDFRTRQMAATLLAELGPQAAAELKRAIGTEATVEQRFRLLEVADVVTQDLREELEYSLGDANSKVRRAGFRLFERLKRDELIPLVAPYASDEDPAAARGAIRSLGQLASDPAVEALLAIRKRTQDPNTLIACCQAMGQIGNATCIEALAGVLGERKFLFFGRRWDEQVRTTAAQALRQISNPKAAEHLSHFVKDREARVRNLAQAANKPQG